MKEQYLSLSGLQNESEEMIQEITRGRFRINPRRWNADISRSALIITDMQNYFLLPDSHAFIPSATAILPNIIMLAGFFRKCNRPVIFTKHINDEDNAHSMNYWWKDMIRDETPSAKLFDNLLTSGDIILEKNQYDAFHNTGLEEILLKHNVR
ncbi:MAG: isochorismatase family cysteine hydrolase, partial [Bacteroidales bacterium]|nr:isochorismatase family cysteine hydrolase [Bacteroidales bacterium]